MRRVPVGVTAALAILLGAASNSLAYGSDDQAGLTRGSEVADPNTEEEFENSAQDFSTPPGVVMPGQGLLDEPSQTPLLDVLRSNFQRESFRVGLLIQSVYSSGAKGTATAFNTGFSVGDTRFILRGKLDKGFGYYLKLGPGQQTVLLDAVILWDMTDRLRFSFGQFKAPFSHEAITPTDLTDLINRAQVVTTLAPGRQVGAQLYLHSPGRGHELMVGAFNGNGPNTTNDDEELLSVARARARLLRWGEDRQGTDGAMFFGVSWATSTEKALDVTAFPAPNTTLLGTTTIGGHRDLLGYEMDARVGDFGVKGEWIQAHFRPKAKASFVSEGFFAQVHGWFPPDKLQWILRYDSFTRREEYDPVNFRILAVNYLASEVVSFTLLFAKAEDDGAVGIGLADNLFQLQMQIAF